MLAALRFAPFIAAAAVVVGLWLHASNLERQRDVARKTALELTIKLGEARAIQEDAERARQVAEAHAKRAVAEAARWGELMADIEAMEGGDAPLSDYLARAAARLWGAQNTGDRDATGARSEPARSLPRMARPCPKFSTAAHCRFRRRKEG